MCNATFAKQQHNPSKDICRPLAKASGDLDRVIRIESERKTLCDTAPSRGRMFARKGVAVTPQFPVFLFRKVQAQGGHFEYDDWKEWQSVNGSMNYCNLVRSLSKFPEVAGIDPVFQLSYYNEIERWANAAV